MSIRRSFEYIFSLVPIIELHLSSVIIIILVILGLSFNTISSHNNLVGKKQYISEGQEIYDGICDRCPAELSPIVVGLLTSKPRIDITVPKKEWDALSHKQQVALTYYVESLIPKVRKNPGKYINIPQTAPLYPSFEKNVSKLCSDCWSITVGNIINGNEITWDECVVIGDSAWDQDTGGIKASNFRK